MVRRFNDSGTFSWLEPPFTPEEEAYLDTWQINAPPVSVLRKPVEPKEPKTQVNRRNTADRAP